MRARRALALLAATLAAASGAAAQAPVPAPPDAGFETAPDGTAAPLLTWDMSHALMRPGAVPLVQVHADGRVVVTRPPGHLAAGTFDYAVTPDELAGLESLALAAASAGAAGSERVAGGSVLVRETTRSDGRTEREVVNDPTLTIFEYRPRDAASGEALPDGDALVMSGYLAAPADDGSALPMASLQERLQAFFTRPLEALR